ncbi:S8 family serine peptidase [Bacillus chungangensis]|uniref:Subtilisin family serine protease n=1 Tax=Bacillus chungangensis TaxID=587633 RepID=A0ABT9WXQ1_9BACI|nr:S8 family serine peptidase [Bacillus chungangensis]MDQ0178019.1 subtilisin family serine protease [Bacillus chungangensis]
MNTHSRKIKYCFFLTLIFLSLFAVNVKADSDKRVFVFKDGIHVKTMIAEILRQFTHTKVEGLPTISAITIETEENMEEIERFIKIAYEHDIESIGTDLLITHEKLPLLSLPFQHHFSLFMTDKSIYDRWRWDLEQVTNNGESYSIQTGNHDVKVAVIDSGLDFHHPDLKDNIISRGKSFINGITDTQDYMGHGTMVAGSIAANGRIKGVAPHIGIVPYKVFHTSNASSMDIIEAIIEAADDGMDVINLSLGTYKSVNYEEDRAVYMAFNRALAYTKEKGSFVVASSGTEEKGFDLSDPFQLAEARGFPGDEQYYMPGGLEDAFTVASTNRDRLLAYNSNFGSNVDIGAPGGDFGPSYPIDGMIDIHYLTLTTYPTNLEQTEVSKYFGFDKGYEFMTGTSLAAPKVAAAAALIIAEYQEKHGRKPSVMEIRNILNEGADRTSTNSQFGSGIVNAYKSLQLVQ